VELTPHLVAEERHSGHRNPREGHIQKSINRL
jgi:hypothetical protein